MQQVTHLHQKYDELQEKYGDKNLKPIYGAGEINNPEIMFIFMNPTGRNISSQLDWNGLRAPWLGTKKVWNIFNSLNLLKKNLYEDIKKFKPSDWSSGFSNSVYSDIAKNSVYITNLAKCTQIDARPLSNKIFKEYLDLMYEEIEFVKPKKIVTFGNQVSSIVLNKPISVSQFLGDVKEILNIRSREYFVFPTYYPVGQGQRNMPLALERIRGILSDQNLSI